MIEELTGNIESIEKQLEEVAYLHDPEVKIYNDGIGAYEFWGAKGFDRGNNYAENESDEFSFRVHVADRSGDEIADLIDYLTGNVFDSKSEEIDCKKGNSVHYTVLFKVIGEVKREGDYLTFDAGWVLQK